MSKVPSPMNVGEVYLIQMLANSNEYEGTFAELTRDANGYNYRFNYVSGTNNAYSASTYTFREVDIKIITPASTTLTSIGTTAVPGSTLNISNFKIGKRYELTSNAWPGYWVAGTVDKFGSNSGLQTTLEMIDIEDSIGTKLLSWSIAIANIATAKEIVPFKSNASTGVLVPRAGHTAFPMGNPSVNNIKRWSSLDPDTDGFTIATDGIMSLTTNSTKKTCTCEIRTLSMNGCQCGAHEAEMKAKYGKDWTKPHWR